MLVVTGIFDNERFIPDEPVSIPQKTKVKITIEEANEEKERMTDGNSVSLIESVKHLAFGRLQAYANPSLIFKEQGAWEEAASEKYAIR